MKMLRSIMLMAMVAITGVANAAKVTGDVPFTADRVLKTYIAATTQGMSTGFEQTLDKNVTFSTVRGEKLIKTSTAAFLSSLKANDGVKQDCVVTTKLVSEGEGSAVYEVSMKFSDFTRVDTVTLSGDDDAGRKITSVQTSIK